MSDLGAWQKVMRWPGIEPGSTAWKAAMLTIIPPSLVDTTWTTKSTIRLGAVRKGCFTCWSDDFEGFLVLQGFTEADLILGKDANKVLAALLQKIMSNIETKMMGKQSRLYFCDCHFCPKRKMSTYCRAHSHALTNATRLHEYFPGLSRLLPVLVVLVSFLELHFLGKWPFWLWEGALSLSKSPLKVKRDIFTRKWMR